MAPVQATVRGAGSRDLESLLPLVEAFQEFERIPFEIEAARRNLGRLLEDRALGQVLLAELDGRVIGYAILTYGYDLEFGGMDAYLTDLFLVDAERGRRLGQWLLGEVEGAAAPPASRPCTSWWRRRTTARTTSTTAPASTSPRASS